LTASVAAAGNGGAGISSAISGTVTPYGGGGGGPADSSGVGGSGGVGGGGAGGVSRGATGGSGTVNGDAGQVNTGGGSGGYGVAGSSGNGGSGIVIIRYPDIYPNLTSTTPSLSPTTANGYKIYTWSSTGSGAFTV
jgi:hypothetical protein